MTFGYLLIALACFINNLGGFALSLIAACIHGMSSCFGEMTVLGYLKGFPPDLLVGWGSGTGFAGVVGAGLAVLLLAFDFELSYVGVPR